MASEFLEIRIEENVGGAGVALRAGGNRGQRDRFVPGSQAQKNPADLLVAARRGAMFLIVVEERACDAVGK